VANALELLRRMGVQVFGVVATNLSGTERSRAAGYGYGHARRQTAAEGARAGAPGAEPGRAAVPKRRRKERPGIGAEGTP
jgi:hypothetical protein